MHRSEQEWRTFARGVKQSVGGAKTIGAVNAIGNHNTILFKELKKVSPKMYDYLSEYMDNRRMEIVKATKKG